MSSSTIFRPSTSISGSKPTAKKSSNTRWITNGSNRHQRESGRGIYEPQRTQRTQREERKYKLQRTKYEVQKWCTAFLVISLSVHRPSSFLLCVPLRPLRFNILRAFLRHLGPS